MINNQKVVEELAAQFGEKVYGFEEPYDLLTFNTTANNIVEIIKFLKENEVLKFQFLTDITGIHLPNVKDNEFGVIYHLHSLENNIRIRIKVFLPESNIKIPSLTGLFESANWMERETFDFFGIEFENHPNLKRILNLDEMNYFPLRKEYTLEDPTRRDKIDPLFGR